MSRYFCVLACTTVLSLAAACRSGGAPEPAPVKSRYPDWVMRGGGAVGGQKNVIQAVGAASGIKNRALRMNVARNRARAELQKTFEVYTASLMKDYASSTATGDLSNSSEEQMVTSVVKTFSAGVLRGVQITNMWEDDQENTTYALATLELDTFMEKINKANELSDRVKERVRRSAERSFADLEREEEKRQNP